MKLFEILKDPTKGYNWKLVDYNGEDGAQYDFETEDDVYKVFMSPESLSRTEAITIGHADMDFYNLFKDKNFEYYEFIFYSKEHGHGITGTGNAIKIFTTVIDIMRNAIGKVPKGEIVGFSSKDVSRTKLYDRFAAKLTAMGYHTKRFVIGKQTYYFFIK